MRSDSGQASLEYVVLLAVVGALVALGGGAGRASGVAEAVVAQVARGLCVVGGGTCDADRRPCPVRWWRDARGWTATLAVVRLGEGGTLLREERSDGSVVITRAASSALAIEARGGRRLWIVDAALRGGVIAAGGGGTSHVLPDAAAADRYQASLARYWRGEGTDRDLPVPTETFSEHVRGVTTGLSAGASVRVRGMHAGAAVDLGVTAEHAAGERLEHATGRRTIYVREASALSRSLSGAVAGLGRRAAGRRAVRWPGGRLGGVPSGGGRVQDLEVTFAADGRPVELALTRAVPVRSAADLPAEASAAEALLPRFDGAERVVVVEQRLDLTDAGSAAAAAPLVDAVRGRRAVAHAEAAAAGLARRLAGAAVVHLRAYAVDGSGRQGGLTVPVAGGEAGVTLERATERARLIGAATRDLGGSWGRRDDCLPA